MTAETKDISDVKTLEKMTAKDLRKLALDLGGIVGVHSMKKEELLVAIKEHKGIADDSTPRGIRVEINRRLKAKIRELGELKRQAREAKDNKRVAILRRKINRLKKQTRKAA